MSGARKKSFEAPDESRTPDKTRLDVVDLDGARAARMTAEPGWRWSDCIKPVVGGDSCQMRHVGTAMSGHLHVLHDDGSEVDLGAGDAYVVEPGHDAWVVGDEAFLAFEFESATAEAFTLRSSP